MVFKHRIWPNTQRHKEISISELVAGHQQTSEGCHKIYSMNQQNLKWNKKNSDNLVSLVNLVLPLCIKHLSLGHVVLK